MDSPLLLLLVTSVASLAALAAIAVFALTLDACRRLSHGVLQWLPYAFLAPAAVSTFTSGRSFEAGSLITESGLVATSGAGTWATRLATVFLLAAAGERLLSLLTDPRRILDSRRRVLMVVFMTFWLTNTLSPQLLGAHPWFGHETLYPLVLGLAILSLSDRELGWLGAHARNACLLFVLASLLTIAVRPTLALDPMYTGFLPGLPRFSGLAPHAVAMAGITQVGLMALWHQPYRRRSMNLLCLALGLTSLLLAQSKTVWLSSLVCFGVLAVLRPGQRDGTALPRTGHAAADAADAGTLAVGRRLGWLMVLFLVLGMLAFSAKGLLSGTVSSAQWHDLSTLSGRDLIWSIAINEWLRNPLFGYGAHIFDAQHRAAIGISVAFHGHNQILDTLARSGLVGGFGMVLFILSTFWLSVKSAGRDGGYALALLVLLAIRGVSEVPLNMFGYGIEVLAPMLLMGALCKASAAQAPAAAQAEGAPRGLVQPRSSHRTGRQATATAGGGHD